MKKILFSISLFISLYSNAQTIDAKFTKCTAVKIENPFKVRWSDTTKAYFMCVAIVSDNIKDRARFSVSLYDSKAEILDVAIVEIKDEDYAAWDGNNRQYPFVYVSKKLGITIE